MGLTATNAVIGGSSNIQITTASLIWSIASTRYLAYTCGSLSGWINADGEITSTKTAVSSKNITFKVPAEWHEQLAANAKTMTCTITLSGSMISSQSTTITLSADESLCAPTVSGTVADVDSAAIALTGNAGKLILGHSDAQCTISASGKYGASIASCSVALSGAAGGTASYDISGGTVTIQNTAYEVYTFRATDSRGITGTYTVTVPTVGYITPTCAPVAERTDPTSGEAAISIKGLFFSGSFGAKTNVLALRYRQSGAEDWIDITSITTNGNSYSASVALTGMDYRSSFAFEIQVSDTLTGWITAAATLGPGLPICDIGEEDWNFNVPVTFSGGLDLGDSDGEINVPGSVLSGSIDAAVVKIVNFNASMINEVLALSQLPTIPSGKIESVAASLLTGTISKDRLPTLTASDVGARADSWMPTASDVGAVPTSRTVNGKALSSNITLTASDVSARESSWTPSASDVGAVPLSRTVNGKSLSSDITLTASDLPLVDGTKLWSGTYQMTASQSISLGKSASALRNGLYLVFAYSDGSTNFQGFFIHKADIIARQSNNSSKGAGHSFFLAHGNLAYTGIFYLYFGSNKITGYDNNGSSGTASGITYDNTKWRLREVWEV